MSTQSRNTATDFNGDLGALPSALKSLIALPHWAGWRWLERNGKRTKPPLCPSDPDRYAKSNDDRTWHTYKKALAGYDAGKFDGVGFMLLDSGFAALDLDDCRDPETGTISPWAKELVEEAATYTEITVSGTGLRIIGRSTGGEIPEGSRKNPMPGDGSLEIYRAVARFTVITGNQLPDTPNRLANIDELIDNVVGDLAAQRDQTKTQKEEGSGTIDIEALHIPLEIKQLIQGHGIDADRSKSVFKVLCALARSGCADAQMVEVMRYPIGDHCRDQANPDGYIERQIKRAREKVQTSATPQKDLPKVLESLTLAEIEMRALDWLWPKRFALGKLGILAGLPDRGKGLIEVYMMACITQGRSWPCGEGRSRRGSVIMLNAEDDNADTLRPRAEAAGADMHRVHVLNAVRQGGDKRMFNLVDDLEQLRQKIDELGDVVAVFIDPVTAYLGVKRIDTARNSDVRAVLSPLKELAGEKHVAIVLVMHFNKATEIGEAMLRIADSLAFVGAARHCFVVLDDKENERRLFVKAKNNLAPDTKALSYTIPGEKEVGFDKQLNLPIAAPYIEWGDEHVDISANEAMVAETKGSNPKAKDRAESFLKDFLAEGEVRVNDIKEEAKKRGRISWSTIERIKDDLGIISDKKGVGKGSYWVWSFLPKEGEDAKNVKTVDPGGLDGLDGLQRPSTTLKKGLFIKKTVKTAPRAEDRRSLGLPSHDTALGDEKPARRPFAYNGRQRTVESVMRRAGSAFYHRREP